jgi:hypothetical protein
MNCENASGRGGPHFDSDTEEMKRVLIRQFYADSVRRYGANSEQAIALSNFLGRIQGQSRSEEVVGKQTGATVMPSVNPPRGDVLQPSVNFAYCRQS